MRNIAPERVGKGGGGEVIVLISWQGFREGTKMMSILARQIRKQSCYFSFLHATNSQVRSSNYIWSGMEKLFLRFRQLKDPPPPKKKSKMG